MSKLPPVGRGLAAALLSVLGLAAQTTSAGGAPPPFKRLSLAELMDIDVSTVSRHTEKLSETPASVQVITGEEIRRSGAELLPQALRLATTLQAAQVSSSYWTIGARGFNASNTTSNKLLVMVDGRSIYSPLFSGTYWDQRDVFLPDVDRIEVISGPGGSTWGANAVNGVINIVSKPASETQGGLLYAGAGEEENALGGFRYGGRLGRSSYYRVYAKHSDYDGTVRANGVAVGDRWKLSQTGFRADWRLDSGADLSLFGDLYHGSIRITPTIDGEFDGGSLTGRYAQTLAGGSLLKVQAFYDSARRGAPVTVADRLDQGEVDAQHELHFGAASQHLWVWGLNYRVSRDHVRNLPTQALLPERFTHRLYSAFAHGEFSLVPERLRLTVGAKFEHNNYSDSDLQPNVRLAWTLTPSQFVWTALSRAVRTPSRFERDTFIPATPPFQAAGGPGFGAEKLWAAELGWRGRLAANTSLSVTAFLHDYDDLRTLELPVPLTFANGLEARTYGTEILFRHQPRPWLNWTLGYTFVKKDFRLRSWSRDFNNGMVETGDPEHQAQLRLGIDPAPKWEIDLGLRAIGRVPTLANRLLTNVGAYTELDARIGYRLRENLTLDLIGSSLLDPAHPETGPANNRREIERSVHGRITWQF